MFAKTIIGSDAFVEMPTSARLLYYDLGMRADDDGFINSPKSIMRMTGASDDDIKLLIAKKFIIPFQSGIVVIKHWNINNYIQKDRYTETKYKEEKQTLVLDENNAYTQPNNLPIQNDGSRPLTDAQQKRFNAKKESDLPYSFDYKIRNAFVGEKCPVCGCTMSHQNNLTKPTIQHNKPISLGGKHEIDNISVICRSCNTSIQNRIITEPLNTEEVKKVWKCIGNVSGMYTQYVDTQVRLGKDSIDKDNNILGDEHPTESPIPYSKIVDYLNTKTGSSYKNTSTKTQTLIKARFNERFTEQDFYTVIDNKVTTWLNDPKMNKYLRPETLFGNKFEGYLNEKPTQQTPPKPQQQNKRISFMDID